MIASKLALRLGLAAGLPLWAAEAMAASPAFCKGYAETAVVQYGLMRQASTPACRRRPGNLWHADRGRHYGWCLEATPAAAKEQNRQRDKVLSSCPVDAGH